MAVFWREFVFYRRRCRGIEEVIEEAGSKTNMIRTTTLAILGTHLDRRIRMYSGLCKVSDRRSRNMKGIKGSTSAHDPRSNI